MIGNTSSGLSKQRSDGDSCCASGEEACLPVTDMTNRALPYGTISQPNKDVRH